MVAVFKVLLPHDHFRILSALSIWNSVAASKICGANGELEAEKKSVEGLNMCE